MRAENIRAVLGSVIVGSERTPGPRERSPFLLVVFDRPPASFDACGLWWRQGGGTQGHRFFATSGFFLLGFSFALIA